MLKQLSSLTCSFTVYMIVFECLTQLQKVTIRMLKIGLLRNAWAVRRGELFMRRKLHGLGFGQYIRTPNAMITHRAEP